MLVPPLRFWMLVRWALQSLALLSALLPSVGRGQTGETCVLKYFDGTTVLTATFPARFEVRCTYYQPIRPVTGGVSCSSGLVATGWEVDPGLPVLTGDDAARRMFIYRGRVASGTTDTSYHAYPMEGGTNHDGQALAPSPITLAFGPEVEGVSGDTPVIRWSTNNAECFRYNEGTGVGGGVPGSWSIMLAGMDRLDFLGPKAEFYIRSDARLCIHPTNPTLNVLGAAGTIGARVLWMRWEVVEWSPTAGSGMDEECCEEIIEAIQHFEATFIEEMSPEAEGPAPGKYTVEMDAIAVELDPLMETVPHVLDDKHPLIAEEKLDGGPATPPVWTFTVPFESISTTIGGPTLADVVLTADFAPFAPYRSIIRLFVLAFVTIGAMYLVFEEVRIY